MTEQNIQDQIIELTDDQLERVVGGWIPPLMRLPIPPPGGFQPWHERTPPTETYRS